jgi:hypothetical protein
MDPWYMAGFQSSAHPEIMELNKAQQCKEIMPERIDYLLDCIVKQYVHAPVNS